MVIELNKLIWLRSIIIVDTFNRESEWLLWMKVGIEEASSGTDDDQVWIMFFPFLSHVTGFTAGEL